MDDSTLIDSWRDWTLADAERRGDDALKPLMESLARAATVLRQADWNPDASATSGGHEDLPGE